MTLPRVVAGSAAIVLASVALSASVAGEQGLVAWWRFDEGAGKQAIDSAANQKDRAVNPRWIPGVSGSALLFDGYTTHVLRPAERAPRIRQVGPCGRHVR